MSSVWDVAGRRTRITHPGGFQVDYAYNVAGDPTTIHKAGTTLLATYAHDDLGRRTSLTRGNGAVTSYGYDAVSRLSQLSHDFAGASYDVTMTYGHNPAGQIASTARTNDVYAWTEHFAVNRGYSANGLNQYSSVAGVTHVYDGRGNLTGYGTTAYGYTTENLLASMSVGGVPTATLNYDPLSRLYQTVGAGLTTRLAYDGANLIAEYDGANGLLRRYVHGPGIDEPLAWYEGSGSTTRRYYHADERGSIVGISSNNGAMYQVLSYDEYGIPDQILGRFQFTGQPWLPEVGLYYYRARMYSPTLGRFMQTDPIGYGDGMNMYAYVGNDPLNVNDPSGLTGGVCTGSRIIASCGSGQNGGGLSAGLSATSSGFSSAGLGFSMEVRTRSDWKNGNTGQTWTTYTPWVPAGFGEVFPAVAGFHGFSWASSDPVSSPEQLADHQRRMIRACAENQESDECQQLRQSYLTDFGEASRSHPLPGPMEFEDVRPPLWKTVPAAIGCAMGVVGGWTTALVGALGCLGTAHDIGATIIPEQRRR